MTTSRQMIDKPMFRNSDLPCDNIVLQALNGAHSSYALWLDNLKRQREAIRVGTLGPSGTSSEMTLLSLKSSIVTTGAGGIEIMLYDNFQSVTEALLDRDVDNILIPNAYNRISDIYWNPQLKIEFYFLHETPKYGLYALDITVKRKDKIMLCVMPACTSIIGHLDVQLVAQIERELRITNSTEEAARLVAHGEADVAITNELCASKYGLTLLSSEYNVPMLWTIFGRR